MGMMTAYHNYLITNFDLHLVDLEDFKAVSDCVLGAWLHHIAAKEAGKFVTGIRPIKSLSKVGVGASKLVTLPSPGGPKCDRCAENISTGLKWHHILAAPIAAIAAKHPMRIQQGDARL